LLLYYIIMTCPVSKTLSIAPPQLIQQVLLNMLFQTSFYAITTMTTIISSFNLRQIFFQICISLCYVSVTIINSSLDTRLKKMYRYSSEKTILYLFFFCNINIKVKDAGNRINKKAFWWIFCIIYYGCVIEQCLTNIIML